MRRQSLRFLASVVALAAIAALPSLTTAGESPGPTATATASPSPSATASPTPVTPTPTFNQENCFFTNVRAIATIDRDRNLATVDDRVPKVGWTFEFPVLGRSSTPIRMQETTDEEGVAFVELSDGDPFYEGEDPCPAVPLESEPVALAEVLQPGFRLADVSCFRGEGGELREEVEVTLAGTRVDLVAFDRETIACFFTNFATTPTGTGGASPSRPPTVGAGLPPTSTSPPGTPVAGLPLWLLLLIWGSAVALAITVPWSRRHAR